MDDDTDSESEDDTQVPKLESREEDCDCMVVDRISSLGASMLSEESPVVPLGLHYGGKQVMKNQLAEKMDVMMAVCLRYLHSSCHHIPPGCDYSDGIVEHMYILQSLLFTSILSLTSSAKFGRVQDSIAVSTQCKLYCG